MTTVFTKIIKGEIPSFKIYEDEWTFALLTRDAVQLGHTIIVPKIEVDYFTEVPEPFYSAVFKVAKPIAQALHKATGCVRVGTMIAGFEVPHFHYHLVPMFTADDLDLSRGKVRSSEENAAMQTKILALLG